MSENSKKWMEKYYPIEASKLCDSSAKECVKHSILKWQGLVNAEEYGLHISQGALREVSGFLVLWIDSDSCALCEKYYRGSRTCPKCPLTKELGRACDAGDSDTNLYSRSLGNPQLMVDVLSKLLKKLTSENENG